MNVEVGDLNLAKDLPTMLMQKKNCISMGRKQRTQQWYTYFTHRSSIKSELICSESLPLHAYTCLELMVMEQTVHHSIDGSVRMGLILI